MKIFVCNDCGLGWREPVSICVVASSKEEAAKIVNGERLFRVTPSMFVEWDTTQKPVLLMTVGGLQVHLSSQVLALTS